MIWWLRSRRLTYLALGVAAYVMVLVMVGDALVLVIGFLGPASVAAGLAVMPLTGLRVARGAVMPLTGLRVARGGGGRLTTYPSGPRFARRAWHRR